MDTDALVAFITAEVLKRLEQAQSADGHPAAGAKRHKVLAIFTGGAVGLDQALTELGAIQGLNAEIAVVLSPAAEEIVGVDRIKEALGADIDIIIDRSPYLGNVLREADAVLVPVLTQNTAAKIAHTFTDSLASALILQALLLGKPVIAAANAADPGYGRPAEAYGAQVAPALRQALKSNLQKVYDYGIQVVDVGCLAAAAAKLLAPAAVRAKTPAVPGKKLLDAAAVKDAAMNGLKSLTVQPGTLVTPLAVDIASEYAVELIMLSSVGNARKE